MTKKVDIRTFVEAQPEDETKILFLLQTWRNLTGGGQYEVAKFMYELAEGDWHEEIDPVQAWRQHLRRRKQAWKKAWINRLTR